MKNKLLDIIQSNNFLSLLGQGLFAIIGLITIMLLTRSYSMIDFGVWVVYLTAFTMINMLRMGFVGTGLVRFVAGADEEVKKTYTGSSWIIGIFFTTIVIIFIYAITLVFPESIANTKYIIFFKWFPLLYIFVLPYDYGLFLLQANSQFGKIIILKAINQIGFISFIAFNLFKRLPIEYVVYAHLGSNLLGSLVALIMGWSGIQSILKNSKETILELFHFGKYSAGTLVGTSLLKSSDTFIIGVLMGPAAAAFYSIPLKLIEMFEIILRSFVAVSLPILSKASKSNNLKLLTKTFYKATGILSVLYIPLVIICFIFADLFILILGGDEYIDSALIFRIFLVYGLFLPLDRFTGVTLDSINRPQANLVKVTFMVIVNVIGDLIAIYWLNEIWAVAIVTINTVLVGILIGMYFLNKQVSVSYIKILPTGAYEIKKILTKFLLRN